MALEDSVNPMQGISGPGPFSKRVDLEYQSEGYGDAAQYNAEKSAAPLAKTADVRGATNTEVRQAAASMGKPVGLFDTTQNNDPIENGLDRGGGLSSSALMMNKNSVKTSDTLAKLLPFDTTGDIAVLYQEAIARGD